MTRQQSVTSAAEQSDDADSGASLLRGPGGVGGGATGGRKASPYPHDTPTPPLCENSGDPPFKKSRGRKNLGRGASKGSVGTTDFHERGRDFLFEDEVQRVINAAAHGPAGTRDRLMLLLMYHHGLRASEVCGLKLDDVRMKEGRLWVRRLKGSLSTPQPILGEDMRAIKRYLAKRDDNLPWLFVSHFRPHTPLTRKAVHDIVSKAGKRCGLRVWPHMLRHSCGYYLANKGADFRTMQDYLGHRDPKHTVRYTRVAGKRFEGLWD